MTVELHDVDAKAVLDVIKKIRYDLTLLEKHVGIGDFHKAQANKDAIASALADFVTFGYFS